MTGLLIWGLFIETVLLVLAVRALRSVFFDLDRLRAAATELYFATRWRSTEPHRLSEHTEALLWQSLRNELELEPGTATFYGVGDPNA